jgi:hypothetical protein
LRHGGVSRRQEEINMKAMTNSLRVTEHREVASRMPEEFTLAQFRRLYAELYPQRPLNSIMPYEFFKGRHIKTETDGPKFLVWLGRGRYRRDF